MWLVFQRIKMMGSTKKIVAISGTCAALVVIFAVIFISYMRSSKWERLNEFKEFESIQENQITEIRLRSSISSANWAVFSDNDLIQKWCTFLNNVEVKKASNLHREVEEDGGGGWVVDVKTETKEVSMVIKTVSGVTKLELDGELYDIRGVDEIPLEETYDAAVERHGVQTPWG